jgi:hypothetical protein
MAQGKEIKVYLKTLNQIFFLKSLSNFSVAGSQPHEKHQTANAIVIQTM